MTQPELEELDLAEKLRRFRADTGLALEELAARSGVPHDRLEAFESSRDVPAVGELVKLAGALNISLGHFFQRAIPKRRIEVVRAQDRWTVEPKSEMARSLNYRYQSLSYNLTEKLMSPFLVEVPPDASSEALVSTHAGEEFIFVLAGQLEATVGGEVHRLAPGDSIYFDSRLEHALRAVEGTSVRMLVCVAEERRVIQENPIRRAYP